VSFKKFLIGGDRWACATFVTKCNEKYRGWGVKDLGQYV